jgi:hypothetical protein
MKTYQVWVEGYRATGDQQCAQMLGEYEAESFKAAVRKAAAAKNATLDVDEGGSLSWWGCRFYDNETDARRSFG